MGREKCEGKTQFTYNSQETKENLIPLQFSCVLMLNSTNYAFKHKFHSYLFKIFNNDSVKGRKEKKLKGQSTIGTFQPLKIPQDTK